MNKTLILYHLKKEEQNVQRFAEIAAELGFAIIELKAADGHETLESILLAEDHLRARAETEGEPGAETAENSGLPEDIPQNLGMVILAGCDKEAFNELMQGWHAANVSGVALKCIVTETNRSWTIAALFSELWREEKMTRAFVTLRRRVRRIENNQRVRADRGEVAYPLSDIALSSLKEAKNLLENLQDIDDAAVLIEASRVLNDAWPTVF